MGESAILEVVYNDFAGGILDCGECIAEDFNTIKVGASVGKSKIELTPVDVKATFGDVIGMLGSFVEFNVSKAEEDISSDDVAKQQNSFSLFIINDGINE